MQDYYKLIASKLDAVNGINLVFDSDEYQWKSEDGDTVDIDGVYLGTKSSRNFELEPLAFLMWINYEEHVVVEFDVDSYTGSVSCGPCIRYFEKEKEGIKFLPSFDRATRKRHGITHPYPYGS